MDKHQKYLNAITLIYCIAFFASVFATVAGFAMWPSHPFLAYMIQGGCLALCALFPIGLAILFASCWLRAKVSQPSDWRSFLVLILTVAATGAVMTRIVVFNL